MEEFNAAGDHLHSALRRYESATGGLGMSLHWPTFINRFRSPPTPVQHAPLDHPLPIVAAPQQSEGLLPFSAAPQQFDHVSIPKTSFATGLLTLMPTPDPSEQLVVQPSPKAIRPHQTRTASTGDAKKPLSWKPAREKKGPPAKGHRIKPSPTNKKRPARSKQVPIAAAARTSASTVCYDCNSDYTSGAWRYRLEGDALPGPTCCACYQKRRRAKQKAAISPERYLELSEDDSDADEIPTTIAPAELSDAPGPSRPVRVSGPSASPPVPAPSMIAPSFNSGPDHEQSLWQLAPTS